MNTYSARQFGAFRHQGVTKGCKRKRWVFVSLMGLSGRQRLAARPKKRLQGILTQLSADWQPGQIRRSIPRCWHPEQFFQQAEHQNLWNNTPQHKN